MNKNKIKSIAKNENFSISKEAIDKLDSILEDITKDIIKDSIRNAKLLGRKTIRGVDIV